MIKVGYVTIGQAPSDPFLHIFWFVHLAINTHTKFEVFNFTHSRDIEELGKFKSRSRDLGHAPT